MPKGFKGFQKKYNATREQLEAVYAEHSCQEGSKMLGISTTHFHRLLRKFNIPRRTLSEAHKLYLSRLSPEQFREIISQMKKNGTWNKGTKGVMKAWNKGKRGVYTQETLAKISKGTKRAMSQPDVRKKVRAHRLSQVFPAKDTIIERKMQEELRCRGLPFETHKSVLGICQPDIVFPESRIAVFCDGDYWHNREGARAKDMFQTMMLSANGWKVLRFWEHEINADVKECVDKIEEEIASRNIPYRVV
jgi:DNA mismatch endonuclease (patch repair protein)